MSLLQFIVFSLLLAGFEGHASQNKSVASSATEIQPLLVGQQIPDGKLKSLTGKYLGLRMMIEKKPTVLVFYRGGWCPFCNLQLQELKESMSELRELGFQILAITPDRTEELERSNEKHKLTYELFSDPQSALAQAFGVAFRIDDATKKKYQGMGIDLEKATGNNNSILPVPAVFIISKNGEIEFEYVNPNYKVRLKKEILLTTARALSRKK